MKNDLDFKVPRERHAAGKDTVYQVDHKSGLDVAVALGRGLKLCVHGFALKLEATGNKHRVDYTRL